MSERLSRTLPSGVYRTNRAEGIVEAARARGLYLARVAPGREVTKARLLDALAAALNFPDWFGGNWDALEECLSDLSWISADGICLLIEDTGSIPGEQLEMLCSVLDDVAASWGRSRRPFYAVLVPGVDALPELDRAGA